MGPWESGLDSRAGDRGYSLGCQIDLSKEVVLRIGDVERGADERASLRVMELGLLERAVARTLPAASDDIDQLPVERTDHDTVVVAVGNVESLGRLIRQHLAGKPQWRRFESPCKEIEANGGSVEQFLARVVGHVPFEEGVERFEAKLATLPGNEIPLRVDDPQRRPGARCVGLPYLVIRIDQHRMLDVIPHDRIGDVVGIFFGRELRRVDADDDDLVGIGLFELLEFREDMHAVDAAVGPEVDHHPLAAQVLEPDRAGRIEPLGIPGKLGSSKSFGKGVAVRRITISRLCGRLLGCHGRELRLRERFDRPVFAPKGLVRGRSAGGCQQETCCRQPAGDERRLAGDRRPSGR